MSTHLRPRPQRPPRGRTHSTLIRFLFLLIGVTALPVAAAWGQTQDTLSASLARRLAEAADGLRDGQPHWMVAERRFPHIIRGIFPTYEAARAVLTRFPTAGAFGPFVTNADFGAVNDVSLFGCTHLNRPIPSVYHPYCPGMVVPWDSLTSLSLVAVTRRDTLRMDLMDPRADAIFLSASSIQKFVLPYYTRLYGPEYASALWDSVAARARRGR